MPRSKGYRLNGIHRVFDSAASEGWRVCFAGGRLFGPQAVRGSTTPAQVKRYKTVHIFPPRRSKRFLVVFGVWAFRIVPSFESCLQTIRRAVPSCLGVLRAPLSTGVHGALPSLWLCHLQNRDVQVPMSGMFRTSRVPHISTCLLRCSVRWECLG